MRTLTLALMLALSGCGGGGSTSTSTPIPPPIPSGSIEREISPLTIDPRVDTATEPHVAITPATNVSAAHRLFVFLPGTQGIPDYYRLVLRSGAARGYHALGLNYPNSEAVGVTCALRSSDCFWDVRYEVLTGSDSSPLVEVGEADAITTRLAKAIAYLHQNHPDEGWDQFLSGGLVDWSKIVVGGHSQGGGHAGVMSKLHAMAGACYFSSPADWSVIDQAPASWTARTNLTPTERQYGFGNVHDTLVKYDELIQIWAAIGLTAFGAPVSVDSTDSFGGTHLLTTAVPGNGDSDLLSPEHGSTVLDLATPMTADGQPVFDPVWAYMCFR